MGIEEFGGVDTKMIHKIYEQLRSIESLSRSLQAKGVYTTIVAEALLRRLDPPDGVLCISQEEWAGIMRNPMFTFELNVEDNSDKGWYVRLKTKESVKQKSRVSRFVAELQKSKSSAS